jgi:hypothetical protein
MEADMHYYGTLAMAIAAGIPQKHAEIIAYASQFVDDSTSQNSSEHEDHGLLFAVGTSHHPLQSFVDRVRAQIKEGTEEQRKIWVPFHYLPGGKGSNFSEKLLCVKNGDIAQEMLKNNLEVSLNKPYGLALMGITAHAYMDTFSHYGFSGIASSYNKVIEGTISYTKEPENSDYIEERFRNFFERYFVGPAAQILSKLGHAGLAQYPDRPFLQYQFDFEKPRPGNGVTSKRDNKSDFLEGCKCLHDFFSKFARAKYPEYRNLFSKYIRVRHGKTCRRRDFRDIEEVVNKVIAREARKEDRIEAWRDSGLINGCTKYDPETWEQEKNNFSSKNKNKTSEEGIDRDVYRFHQAATYHRYYVLKDLLPAHGIAVY